MREAIRAHARAEGFDAVGFTCAVAPEGAGDGLKNYLARGHHGDMGWMEGTAKRRADPDKTVARKPRASSRLA